MNDADLIGKYVELRDYVQKEEAATEERLKPYKAGMEKIANAMLERLNSQNTQSIKTNNGTAYISTLMSAKVVDRDKFIEYVTLTNSYDLLTSNVAKDALKERLESDPQVPVQAGIDITYISKALFRRS